MCLVVCGGVCVVVGCVVVCVVCVVCGCVGVGVGCVVWVWVCLHTFWEGALLNTFSGASNSTSKSIVDSKKCKRSASCVMRPTHTASCVTMRR